MKRAELHGLLDESRGVWAADEELYRDLVERVEPGLVSLETGAGLSTMLLAAAAGVHHCITPSSAEVEVLRTAIADRGLTAGRVTFHVDRSDRALPRLDADLDLVLIDGGHAYPTPQIDWYYAGGRLRPGGLLYVDDLQLPAVEQLAAFLQRDPRWRLLRRTAKWGVWRRESEGELAEEWTDQRFWRPSIRQRACWFWRRGWRRLRRRSLRRARTTGA